MKNNATGANPGNRKGILFMFRNYVNAMLSNQPYTPMFEADTGSGGGSDSGSNNGSGNESGSGDENGSGNENGSGDDKGADGGDDQGGNNGKDDNHDNKVTFSDDQQAFINNLINKTIKEERSRAEKEREKELNRQKMSEEEKREQDLKETQAKLDQFKSRSLTYEIKDVAREMGVPANKLERFLKLVDKEEINVDDEGNVERTAVSTAVKAVLGDFPEFKASNNQKGPGSDFDKGSNNGAKYSMAQIKDMSQEEIKNNWDDVQKSMSIHNKTKK